MNQGVQSASAAQANHQIGGIVIGDLPALIKQVQAGISLNAAKHSVAHTRFVQGVRSGGNQAQGFELPVANDQGFAAVHSFDFITEGINAAQTADYSGSFLK